ncbi:tail assembly protein [Pseudomonas sp. GNP012]
MAATVAHYSPRTRVQLTRQLANKFGEVHHLLLDSGQGLEVFKALNATIPGFQEEIKRLDRLGMCFAIYRNGKNAGLTDLNLSGTRVLKIVPVISGSKRAGVLQTVVGAVLIAAAYFNPFGAFTGSAVSALYAAGIASTAGGVIQMLSPQQGGLSYSSSPENAPSYAFGSAKNTTASGNPVPICIGERRWGGMIISASINAEDKT